MLERMLEADDLDGRAQDGGSGARRRAEGGRRRAPRDGGRARRAAGVARADRAPSAPRWSPALDPQRARRCSSRSRASATASRVAEARDGVCTICHVRLRPQVFNTVRRNDAILQCDTATASSTSCPRRPPPRRAGRRRSRVVTPTSLRALRLRSTPRPDRSSPTSTAARAAIPGRPATASASSSPTARSSRSSASRSASRPTTSPNTARCSPRSSGRARHGHRALHVRSDSLLLVQQMLGNYKVKNAGLQPLHAKARLLAHEIGRVTFEHVGRALNAHADRLANAAMDERPSGCERARPIEPAQSLQPRADSTARHPAGRLCRRGDTSRTAPDALAVHSAGDVDLVAPARPPPPADRAPPPSRRRSSGPAARRRTNQRASSASREPGVARTRSRTSAPTS